MKIPGHHWSVEWANPTNRKSFKTFIRGNPAPTRQYFTHTTAQVFARSLPCHTATTDRNGVRGSHFFRFVFLFLSCICGGLGGYVQAGVTNRQRQVTVRGTWIVDAFYRFNAVLPQTWPWWGNQEHSGRTRGRSECNWSDQVSSWNYSKLRVIRTNFLIKLTESNAFSPAWSEFCVIRIFYVPLNSDYVEFTVFNL